MLLPHLFQLSDGDHNINKSTIHLIVDDDVQGATDWEVGELGHLQSLLVHALADHGGIPVNLRENNNVSLQILTLFIYFGFFK